MRVLILSYSFGEGHNSAARALEKELKSRGIFCYTMPFEHVMDRGTETIIKSMGKFLLIGKGRLNKTLYNITNSIDEFDTKSSAYHFNKTFSKKLYKYIRDNKFNLVICTHLFPAECMTAINKKHKKIKFINISTDYVYLPFLNEISADYFVIPHEDLILDFINKGIDKSKILPFGIPINTKFIEKLDIKEARIRLNLPLNKKIILFMSGGTGHGNILKRVSEYKQRSILIVACGNNKALYEKIKEIHNKKKNILPLEFVNNIDEYMSACDILITKPGGLSTTEAAVKEIPIIHIDPIPGVETFNLSFFKRKNMSLEPTKDIFKYTDKILKNKKILNKISENQKEYINKNSTKDICDFIEKTYKNGII